LNKSQADFFLIEFIDITIYNDSALTVSFRICLSWSQHKMHFSWNQQYAWASCHFSVALLGRSSVSVIFAQKAWHTLSHFVSVTNNFSQQGIVSIQSWAHHEYLIWYNRLQELPLWKDFVLILRHHTWKIKGSFFVDKKSIWIQFMPHQF